MACRDTNTTLSLYIGMAILLDNLRCQHNVGAHPRHQPHHHTEFLSPREEGPEPMQLGRAHVSEEERLHRTDLRLCYYCGQPGHQVYRCPKKPSTSQGKPKRLSWTDQAGEEFIKLKLSFTTAQILQHPDPYVPFVVEVDASSCGISAVLSQCQCDSGKIHPCAYYSRKLTAAEANYEVGNRELLSIKAALEEWRHWLEGAQHPFLDLTDHRNLHGAKCLNPRQAHWALFFTRFQFSVTYCPGSKNGKADTSSRQLESRSPPLHPDHILPLSLILAPI
ncbi:hypothetical protein QTP86_010263 [Hemibagrus guttatus]|nr:hypothetical protein QTP86_010263 [Hemibagrus guttatus]